MRPIDADYLENMGYELHRTYRQDANTMVYEVKKITDVPTMEAEPVRRGHWETVYKGVICCSVCGHCGNETNYCPTCGARMEEQEGD